LNKHKEREAARALASRKKDAQTILGKIGPVLTSIEAVVAVGEFGILSVQLREPLEIKQTFLSETLSAANIIVASEAADDINDLPEIASLMVIMEALSSAKKIVARVTNVLAAIARLHH
jgi:hypothetical protein